MEDHTAVEARQPGEATFPGEGEDARPAGPIAWSSAPAPRDEHAAGSSHEDESGENQQGEVGEVGEVGEDDEVAEPARDPYEGAVPPGYDWPTHGGYLGCLLGLMAACAVAGFLGGTWIPLIAAPSLVKVALSLVVGMGALVGLGRLGWVLGKRFYREYPEPVRGRRLPPREQGGM